MIFQPATFDDNWGYKSIAVFTGYTKLRKTYQGRAGLGKILRPQLLAFLLSWQDVFHSGVVPIMIYLYIYMNI